MTTEGKTADLFAIKCENIPERRSFKNINFDFNAPDRPLFISTGTIYKPKPPEGAAGPVDAKKE